MQILFSWLKEWVPTKLSVAEIAEVLTLAGLEVEGVQATPLSFEGVIVGEVLQVEPHPDAERLRVATVSDGKETYTVVCGASNCAAGKKYPFAPIGARLQKTADKPFKIKRAKLRGVESQGMLCAAVELELGDDDGGILELPVDWETGRDLSDYYGDVILELALTPNLGHCFSLRGVARELAAIVNEPLRPPSLGKPSENNQPIAQAIKVTIETPESCPRYSCRMIQGVAIGPSPEWLRQRLEGCGLRSINNVVDVTNLVMLELGQPLHAFDYDQLEGQQIVVRQATDGEQFTALDGTTRTLSKEVVLICDGHKPVALGGVMGGQNSEVSGQTTNILLESAYFEASAIRRAAKQAQLSTDSSKRFERGVDPNGVVQALERATALIQEVAGGEVLQGVVDAGESDFPRRTIKLRLERLNQLLGTQLAMTEVESLLDRLACEVVTTEDQMVVTVPTYRSDLAIEVDLIEEIGRLYGYANIAVKTPAFKSTILPHSPLFLFEREVRRQLIGDGLQELITSALISPKLTAETLPDQAMVAVLNPSSVEQSVLRPSLLPGLLHVVQHNAAHQLHDIAGFEIGRVHFQHGDEFEEQTVVGIIFAGEAETLHWDQPSRLVDFYDLKGIVESLLARIGVINARFERAALPHFHPGRQAGLVCGEQEVGFLGEVHPARVRSLELTHPVLYAELDLSTLLAQRQPIQRMKPLPQYPGSFRDYTVTLTESTSVGEFLEAVRQIPSRLLKKVTPTVIYRGDSVDEGCKNATFRFVYRDDRKTIASETVEAEHGRIVQGVQKQLGERVRQA